MYKFYVYDVEVKANISRMHKPVVKFRPYIKLQNTHVLLFPSLNFYNIFHLFMCDFIVCFINYSFNKLLFM